MSVCLCVTCYPWFSRQKWFLLYLNPIHLKISSCPTLHWRKSVSLSSGDIWHLCLFYFFIHLKRDKLGKVPPFMELTVEWKSQTIFRQLKFSLYSRIGIRPGALDSPQNHHLLSILKKIHVCDWVVTLSSWFFHIHECGSTGLFFFHSVSVLFCPSWHNSFKDSAGFLCVNL